MAVCFLSRMGYNRPVLKSRPVTNSDEWNGHLIQLAGTHVLQSWEWGEFKVKYGWTPTRVLFCDDGPSPRAAAQILRRPLPHTPFGIMYVPKGPAVDFGDSQLVAAALAQLEQIARKQNAIFVKIDPDVDSSIAPILTARGWRPSREQIQFRNTVLLDLGPSEDQLLAVMRGKTRYNIRLAQKRGVRVERGTIEDLRLFYEMYAETGARDGFLIRKFPYYRDAWGAFLQAGRAEMLLARVAEETIAGLILFVLGTRAWYFYGASRNAHRELMPNHLLQWEAIRWAKAHGCTVYDFWGAPDTLDENAPMYGVYRFKEGFGGKFTPHIGAYDYVVNPLLYFLYAVVRPAYPARLRKRHAQSEL